jgi:hypothetical protein
VYRNGWDPHATFAETCMGDQFRNAPGYNGWGKKPTKKTLADALRDIAKRLRYAGAYAATPETIFRVLRSAVDENGRLQNPNLKLDQVYLMHENWMAAEPEWRRAWENTKNRWKLQGYLDSPMLGRRRDFLDKNPNDVVNSEILSTEGDIMGDMTGELVEAIPFEYAGPGTGLINQCHDSMTLEVPEHDADRVYGILQRIMTREIPGWEIPITCEGARGRRWSET